MRSTARTGFRAAFTFTFAFGLTFTFVFGAGFVFRVVAGALLRVRPVDRPAAFGTALPARRGGFAFVVAFFEGLVVAFFDAFVVAALGRAFLTPLIQAPKLKSGVTTVASVREIFGFST